MKLRENIKIVEEGIQECGAKISNKIVEEGIKKNEEGNVGTKNIACFL